MGGEQLLQYVADPVNWIDVLVLHWDCPKHEVSKDVEKAFKKNKRLQAAFDKAVGKGEVGGIGQ
jgi:hypothetical protein